jgi:hypothetical protein
MRRSNEVRGRKPHLCNRVIPLEPRDAHPCWRERKVWLKFFEAAWLSLEFGTGVVFG